MDKLHSDSILIAILASLIVSVGLALFIYDDNYVEAHVNKIFGNISLDVGWSTEPPLIDEINNIVILVEDTGSGQSEAVINALADTTTSIMYGRVSEPIDFVPSGTTDGLYESEIIPTRLGTYSVIINGTIKQQPIVNAKFDIEEVEGKESISFPDKDSGASQDNVDPNMQSALSQLAIEINDVDSRISGLENNSLDTRSELDNIRSSQDLIYLVASVGIGTGVGGIVMAAYFINYRMKMQDRK
jgi:hypothetical protein